MFIDLLQQRFIFWIWICFSRKIPMQTFPKKTSRLTQLFSHFRIAPREIPWRVDKRHTISYDCQYSQAVTCFVLMFAVSWIRLHFWVWVLFFSQKLVLFFFSFFCPVCRSFIEGIEFGVAKVFATRQPASALATILLFARLANRQKKKTCYNCANSEVFFVFPWEPRFPRVRSGEWHRRRGPRANL